MILALALACTTKAPPTGDPSASPTTPTLSTATTPSPTDTTVASDTASGTGDSAAPTLYGTVPPTSLPVPAFTQVLANDGTPRTSADLVGHPTVLWFYQVASTASCTIEGCGLRDLYSEFDALGVTVVGVSFDPPSANQDFIDVNGFQYELWSDVGRELATYYRAVASQTDPVPDPDTRVLDSAGALVLVYDQVSTTANPGEVLSDCEVLFGP